MRYKGKSMLSRTSGIGVAVVEFVIGRIVVMFMLLLLFYSWINGGGQDQQRIHSQYLTRLEYYWTAAETLDAQLRNST